MHPEAGELFLVASHHEHDAANQRQRACDWRQGYIMRLVAGSVNRSDVNDLFPGGVSESTPDEANQAKRNQDYSERFVHRCLLSIEQSRYFPLFYRLHATGARHRPMSDPLSPYPAGRRQAPFVTASMQISLVL
jgi:hypothetical protein